MAIQALPKSTIQLLGSSQVLTSSTSLVKELIDNALDARATVIDIQISQNTVDKIEVRDNGHGIAREDLDALGRRGHTSKLRAFEELKDLGGSSLGFRGEAFFSATQLGQVIVTTRIDGQAVALCVKLKEQGGIDSQKSASHPIGTTVSVSEIFKKLPVRRQGAIGDASKTITNIRLMIQSYALARHGVRLNFKVTKEGKGSWSYAPRTSESLQDAVVAIIGRDAATAYMRESRELVRGLRGQPCEGEEFISPTNDVSPCQSGYYIDAYLLRPGSGGSSLTQHVFISVDGRPVSAEKGTMKKVVKMYKKHVCRSITSNDKSARKMPFLHMNLTCPSGSYDPNVEPAKDDLIFSDEDFILTSIASFFRDIYGDNEVQSGNIQNKGTASVLNVDDRQNYNFTSEQIIASVKTRTAVSSPIAEASALHHAREHRPIRSPGRISPEQEPQDELSLKSSDQWAMNLSTSQQDGKECEIPELRRLQQKSSGSIPEQYATSPTETNPDQSLNPWLLAKMTASTMQRPCSPESVINSREPKTSDAIPVLHTGKSTTHHPPRRSGWTPPTSRVTNVRCSDETDFEVADVNDARNMRVDGFVTARDLVERGLPSPPPTQISERSRHEYNMGRDLTSSSNAVRRPATDQLHQTKLLINGSVSTAQHGTIETPRPENSELSWAMDFERRKEAATRARRAHLKTSSTETDLEHQNHEAPSSQRSPHKARYAAAVTRLRNAVVDHGAHDADQELRETGSTLAYADPRSYLLRRQNSLANTASLGARVKRVQTNLLPLETVPATCCLHDLVTTVHTSMIDIEKCVCIAADMHPSTTYDPWTARTSDDWLQDYAAIRLQLPLTVNAWLLEGGRTGCKVEYKNDLIAGIATTSPRNAA